MPTDESHATSRIAIVTVSYGSGQVLSDFLSSLHKFHSAALSQGLISVAVVDNKPDHESVDAIADQFGATYVVLPENPGYGAGMHAGVEALEATLKPGESFGAYFFCNPDVTFIEEVAQHLAVVMRADSSIGAIAPRVLNEDGSVYSSARNVPSIGTGVGHAIFSRVWPGNPWSRAYTAASDYESARSAGWLSGAAVMVRSDVYREIDGWDDNYFMYFEDVDLGWRISQHGYDNRFEPSVSVVHSGAHSTQKHAVKVEQAMTQSAIRFMKKRYSGALRAPLRWAIVLGLNVRGWFRTRSALRG